MSLINLDDRNTFLPQAQAIVTVTSTPVDVNFSKSYVKNTPTIAGVKAVRWGADGKQPLRILKAVAENHIKPQLLKTERDFLLGSRDQFFKEILEPDPITKKLKRILEPVEEPEIDDWAEMVDLPILLRKLSFNYVYCKNYFLSCSLDSRTKKVNELQSWDFNTILAEEQSGGRINNYFYHPYWDRAIGEEVKTIPTFDKSNPTKFAQCMYHGRDWTPGQPYYDWAQWWGSENWTDVSNLIPKFHRSGLLNGYNIKYHIEMPASYFAQFGDIAKQKEAEKQLKENMNDFLGGVENVEKAFMSKFATDEMGKILPGFKITPLQNFMTDEAYIRLDNNANINQASAHGINPALASIDTGGKLGGSGLELKVAYQTHIAIRTPNDREILTEWFSRMIMPIMGWKAKYGKIILGFDDIDISVADTNANPNKPAAINNKMG